MDDINITGVVGTNEYELSDFISIYPNPTSGEFTVQSSGFNVQTVEVYNLMGEKVLSSTLNSQFGTLNLSEESNGMYFIQVSDGNSTITKKLNKQ